MIATFVKKDFSKKDWEHYIKIPGYMFLEKSRIAAGDDVSAAFSMPTEDGQAPNEMYLLDDDELRRYDLYCKGNNHHPQPFDDVKIAEEKNAEEKLEEKDRMEVIRENLKNKFQMKV